MKISTERLAELTKRQDEIIVHGEPLRNYSDAECRGIIVLLMDECIRERKIAEIGNTLTSMWREMYYSSSQKRK